VSEASTADSDTVSGLVSLISGRLEAARDHLVHALSADASHIPALLLLRLVYQIEPRLVPTPCDAHPNRALLDRAKEAYARPRARAAAEAFLQSASGELRNTPAMVSGGGSGGGGSGGGGGGGGGGGDGDGGDGGGDDSLVVVGAPSRAPTTRRTARRSLAGTAWQDIGKALVSSGPVVVTADRPAELLYLQALYLDAMCDNSAAAAVLYRAAADADFAPAMFGYGMVFENGLGVRCVRGVAVSPCSPCRLGSCVPRLFVCLSWRVV
jgi:hypothetical protein